MKGIGRLLAISAFWATSAAAQEPPPDPTTWNVWLDGRLIGVVDRTVGQQSFGSYATVGAENKVMPWLTLGLGVGYENLNTQSWAQPGVRSVENGFGLQPYATAQLNPNLFLTAFASVMRLHYDATVSPGVSGQFDAWRWIGGGSLTGIWHADAWRLQPVLTVLYGSENQQGYTTSAGANVAAQDLPFGRVSLGPEIGYAFKKEGVWAIEPFAFARGNFDYVQPNATVFNGTAFSSSLHGRWSASLGGGVSLSTRQGFFARLQASNESVGQNGLEVWMGEIRGGWKF